MRILCITSSFPRGPADFAGRFVYDLVRALVDAGDEVEVIAPADGAHPEAPVGLPVTRVPYFLPRRSQRLFYRSGAPENLARDPLAGLQVPAATAALTLAACAAARRADVLFAHWLVPAGLAGAAAAASSGRPLVVVAHSGDVHLLSRVPGGASVARFVARRSAAVCAVADDVRQRLQSLGVSSRTLSLGVPPVVPSAARAVLRRRLGVAGRTVLLGLGRLERIKGYDLLLRAARDLPRATVVLAGDGSERARLERLAPGLDVRFAGVVAGADKADLLASSDVAVFPSRVLGDGRTEGLPVALLEALAASLPVVAAAVGGIPEAVGDAAVLVPPEDVAALRAGIGWALQRRRVLASRAARRARRYDLASAAARYRAVLREVAGR